MIYINDIPTSEDLYWSDEFSWNASGYIVKPTIGKKVSVTSSKMLGNSGRPLSLVSKYAWLTREQVVALKNLFDTVQDHLSVKLHDDRIFFAVPTGEGFRATPLSEDPLPGIKALYNININLTIIV